jgi:peroxiredoxin/DNA-binding transcriptional MerR regulator
MRISEIARRAGVTTKTVRYYESLGLVTPGRLANGYRDYSQYDVQLVREVRELNRLGIPAERTRPFLECLAAGHNHADDCPASLVGYRDAIDDLTERISALAERRALLIKRLHEAAYRNSQTQPIVEETGMRDPNHLPSDLPVPRDDGATDHLRGRVMPSIELPSTAGAMVPLHAMGPGRSVLYIYPLTGRPDVDLPEGWDAIPGARGCTPEACGFRDHHRELTAAGAARVLGMSSQDTAYQQELVDRLRLPFSMLSDTEFHLGGKLNLPTFEINGTRLYKRLTLIIHGESIEHVFYPIFPPHEHAQQVLTWLLDHPG